MGESLNFNRVPVHSVQLEASDGFRIESEVLADDSNLSDGSWHSMDGKVTIQKKRNTKDISPTFRTDNLKLRKIDSRGSSFKSLAENGKAIKDSYKRLRDKDNNSKSRSNDSKISSPGIGAGGGISRSDVIAVCGDDGGGSYVSPPRVVMAERVVEAVPSDSSLTDDVPLATRLRRRKSEWLDEMDNSNAKRKGNDNNYRGKISTKLISPRLSQRQSCIGNTDNLSVNKREILDCVEVSELGETILECTRELECLRSKCGNLQGNISGRMKRNIIRIQEGISTLVSRIAVTGDSTYLRIRNNEMKGRIKELEKENVRLEERVKKLLSPSKNSPSRGRHKASLVSHAPPAVVSEVPLPFSGIISEDSERSVLLTKGSVLSEVPQPRRLPRRNNNNTYDISHSNPGMSAIFSTKEDAVSDSSLALNLKR